VLGDVIGAAAAAAAAEGLSCLALGSLRLHLPPRSSSRRSLQRISLHEGRERKRKLRYKTRLLSRKRLTAGSGWVLDRTGHGTFYLGPCKSYSAPESMWWQCAAQLQFHSRADAFF
jgi:hypothetical protein